MNTIPPSILQSGSKSPEPTVHLTASPTDTPKELVSPEPTISLFEDNPERFDDDNPGERHRRRRGKDY